MTPNCCAAINLSWFFIVLPIARKFLTALGRFAPVVGGLFRFLVVIREVDKSRKILCGPGGR